MTGVAAANWIERAFFDVYASTVRVAMHFRPALRVCVVLCALLLSAVSIVLCLVHDELHSTVSRCDSLTSVRLERDMPLEFLLVDRFEPESQSTPASPLKEALAVHWQSDVENRSNVEQNQEEDGYDDDEFSFALSRRQRRRCCDAFDPRWLLFRRQCATTPNARFNVENRLYEPPVFWRYRYMRESTDFGLILLRPSTISRLRLKSRIAVDELANERCFGPYAWLVVWAASVDTLVASRLHHAFRGSGVVVRRSVTDLAARPSATHLRDLGEHLESRITAILKSVCEHVMAEASVEVIMRVLVPIVALELTWFELDAQTRRVLASRAAIAGCLLVFGAVAVQSLMFDESLLDNVFTVFTVAASLVTYVVSCGFLWHAWSRRLLRAAHFFSFLVASTMVEDSSFPPTALWILWWFCCTFFAWLVLFYVDVEHLALVVARREHEVRPQQRRAHAH